MIDAPEKQTVAKRGRKVGSKIVSNPDKPTSVRHAYQLKARVQITERGMENGSRVKFNIPQELATQLFAGSVNVENVFKIGKMISVKNSYSGRLECTLHAMNGMLIGFVLVKYLNAEN